MKLTVQVIPRSPKNEVVGTLPNGTLKIKIKAPPVDGAANEALVKFLSGHFGVPKSRISIIKGLRGRKKIVEIL